jgi:hypothetical protein
MSTVNTNRTPFLVGSMALLLFTYHTRKRAENSESGYSGREVGIIVDEKEVEIA